MSTCLLPLDADARTTNVLYRYDRYAGRAEPLLIKRYRGRGAWAHCRVERQMLRHWRRHGFAVPAAHDIAVPDLAGSPYLVLTYIPGENLSKLLRGALPLGDKLALLAGVFDANRRRHERALELRDPRLVHPDLNSGNILIVAGEPWYIDLESMVAGKDLADAIAVEIAKLARWVTRDLGPVHLEQIVRLLGDCYRGRLRHLLGCIVRRTCARSFQFFHRWRDQAFKAEHLEEVTKYDIADGLERYLPRAG
jgi:Ser/Thr protein kinase RdoA (MazF antagonist)